MQVARYGVVGRAVERGLVEIAPWNPRDFADNRHGSIDDRPYGGGPGMVMQVAPLRAAIHAARAADRRPARVIFLSPQGERLTQQGVARLARHQRLILLCGRYEGIDERLLETEVDDEVSIGDYVLSGGELPAMVAVDATVRMIPGVLGHEGSAAEDSFATGLLDHPHYTRPDEFEGRVVPEVLRSGDHAAVEQWRLKQALGRTWLRRPDLLSSQQLGPHQQRLLGEFIAEYREVERASSGSQEQEDRAESQRRDIHRSEQSQGEST